MSLSIGVAVPAYMNATSLKHCLDSIYDNLGAQFQPVVVVDDSGNGEVHSALQDIFRSVEWVVHRGNQGFGRSASEAVLRTGTDFVILLNDDAKLSCDPRAAIAGAFSDDTLFAATFQSQHADATFREGAKRVRWRLGIPRVLHNPADQYVSLNGVQRSDYAVGGHCVVHRNRFAELNGFDEHFAPFYWEDVDLAFRAKHRGWHCVYLPECTVIHDGASAIREHHADAMIRETVWTNRLKFAARHANGLQRTLLPAGRAWLRVQSALSGDRALEIALAKTQIDEK